MNGPTREECEIKGLTLEAVQAKLDKLGFKHRVVTLDGKPQYADCRYVPFRVNIEVDNGIVTGYTWG